MKGKTLKESIQLEKDRIKNHGYKSLKVNNRRGLFGTMYAKEIMEYGFHVYFIHEPNADDYRAGVSGTLSEVYYNLRTREYWIKRNFKEVNFSERNIEAVFASYLVSLETMLGFVSTESNFEMYKEAYDYLSKRSVEKRSMFSRFLYRLMVDYSYFEILFKAGINLNSNHGLNVKNPRGKNPMEILGLSKTRWKMFRNYSVNQYNLSRSAEDNTKDSKALSLIKYAESLEDEYGLEVMEVFVNIEIETMYGKWSQHTARDVAQKFGLSLKRLIRYIYFECEVSQGLGAKNALLNLHDYLDMVKDMGLENYDKYPKYLRTTHDIVGRNYQLSLSDIQLRQWNQEIESHKAFEFKSEDHLIVAPKAPEDLVKEGNILGHCVASYVHKVRKGKSKILFLRREAETPLITVEIQGERIVQARGKMNDAPKREEMVVLIDFAKKFNLSLPKELAS